MSPFQPTSQSPFSQQLKIAHTKTHAPTRSVLCLCFTPTHWMPHTTLRRFPTRFSHAALFIHRYVCVCVCVCVCVYVCVCVSLSLSSVELISVQVGVREYAVNPHGPLSNWTYGDWGTRTHTHIHT